MAEVLLWNELKNKKLLGYDFDRQKLLDVFIVDFYCKELRLALEVDGTSYDFNYEADVIRQQRLEKLGVRFLRFTDEEVKQNITNVMRTITSWVETYTHKTHP